MPQDPASSVLRRNPVALPRHDGGRLAAITLALGSVATLLGKVAEIKKAVFELVGAEWLQSVHLGMSVLVSALFAIGYTALGYWVYTRLMARRPSTHPHLWIAGLALLGLALTGCTLYVALPPPPDVRLLVQEELDAWQQELMGLRKGSGGLRFNRRDPSVTDQVWSTAQAGYAVLTPPGAATALPAATLRGLLDSMEQARLPQDEGWGYYGPFDWGVTEIAAWVVLAELASLRPPHALPIWGPDVATGRQRLDRDLALLLHRRLPSGAWSPLTSHASAHERTYSTTTALWALVEARRAGLVTAGREAEVDTAIREAVTWLLGSYEDTTRSWVPHPARSGNNEPYPGLTAQVIYVIERARPWAGDLLKAEFVEYRRHFFDSVLTAPDPDHAALATRPVSQSERTHDNDVGLPGEKVMLEGSTFLWLPWSLAACSTQALMQAERHDAELIARACATLAARANDLIKATRADVFTYVMAEGLIGLRLHLAAAGHRPSDGPSAGASAGPSTGPSAGTATSGQ